ncbi:MAG: RNA polymerase-associated protein RapA, partial [Pseudomonadales bacterium]|nr:RNA polymerase-associated protein RapA [Pseudomonadales bacterium]
MTDFKPGQKWISNAEPELGMGRVVALEDRQISVHFDMVDARRTYSRRDAPLTRVKFNKGDRLTTMDGIVITVLDVMETEGIFVYRGDYQGTETAVVETELDPNVRFSKPQDRLFTHQIDANAWFNLRYHTLERVSGLSQSRARGLIGPRVSLIPHQIYIASEVAARFAPRVLLADEVGLGKTIEAGLIIHQQLLTGRSERVLIIVPHALTFQWFVEMIRRFNLQFVLLDEERCQQIESDNLPEDNDALETPEEYNPFFAQQLMLCSIDLFTDNPKRLEQALEGEWDLVVVDEAHHLRWTPEEASLEYKVVELISKESSGLLLLTATPEQLGRAGHFARLRLLDPDRFHDYDKFLEEERQYEKIAESANQLLDGSAGEKTEAREQISRQLGAEDGAGDTELVRALLDRHGTGRVLFRNVRSSVEGFPVRLPKPVELRCPDAYQGTRSYYPELDTPGWTASDPRVSWLIELAEQDPGRKFLVICAHTRVAVELERSVREGSGIRTTLFHEDMDLVARDRAATYFSETHQGAQLLIASEIGSEGRNFQFASDLVLFDLPLGPDPLEQRIGRLDRIGQRNDVAIHIPYLDGTQKARLYRWYAEGMDCFASPNPVAQNLFDELFAEFEEADLAEIIGRTREMNDQRKATLERGRDRLLERNSHRRDVFRQLIWGIVEFAGG